MNKKIILKSSISVKKSPGLKNIKYKAEAGLSEAEAIERNTIGKLGKNDEDDEDNEDGENRER